MAGSSLTPSHAPSDVIPNTSPGKKQKETDTEKLKMWPKIRQVAKKMEMRNLITHPLDPDLLTLTSDGLLAINQDKGT